MSALDLDALEQRCKDTIAEWTLVYVQSGETLPDDAVETKAARETLALITRLRAAESERDDLRCEVEALQAERDTARVEVLLAALDAAEAQGYARAMREVVERADHSADYTGWSDYALGHRDAHERLAVWARERLPAAAEKER